MQCGMNPGQSLQQMYVCFYFCVISQCIGNQVVRFGNLFVQDKALASKLLNVSEKHHFYREVASTAESGWDFSTRWMRSLV